MSTVALRRRDALGVRCPTHKAGLAPTAPSQATDLLVVAKGAKMPPPTMSVANMESVRDPYAKTVCWCVAYVSCDTPHCKHVRSEAQPLFTARALLFSDPMHVAYGPLYLNPCICRFLCSIRLSRNAWSRVLYVHRISSLGQSRLQCRCCMA